MVPPTRTLQILVVDDEVSLARMLARTLRRLGHEVTVAAHPRDALDLFHSSSFDAVITDIDMPEMSGVELATAMRSERPDLPIAFCTGSSPTCERSQQAAAIGLVRPKLWRMGDVVDLLATLLPN